MRVARFLFCGLMGLMALADCGKDSAPSSDLAVADMTALQNGCPSLSSPQAHPGDPIGGDTWATFAQGFFSTWCTRCHSTTRTGTDRNGAPDGFNWDDQSSVQAHLDQIRIAVGVGNFMPPNDPRPPCDQRQRIVRWIDAGAP
jgi:hypothetical protein